MLSGTPVAVDVARSVFVCVAAAVGLVVAVALPGAVVGELDTDADAVGPSVAGMVPVALAAPVGVAVADGMSVGVP